ncbi:MAG: hemerythrin domain-containing protein [Patulibacter sp.]|nr:hemerythrin domain-containing protein [Patulibacter sp.]
MQRNPALVSLSHDHHQALFVAQNLRRADAASAEAARAAFGDYWAAHGARHFEVEEQVLLPAFAEVADPHAPLVAQVLCDHVELRRRGREALDAEEPEVEALHVLGRRLAEHVRVEERELFPLIEEALSPGRLARLAAELERAEADG